MRLARLGVLLVLLGGGSCATTPEPHFRPGAKTFLKVTVTSDGPDIAGRNGRYFRRHGLAGALIDAAGNKIESDLRSNDHQQDSADVLDGQTLTDLFAASLRTESTRVGLRPAGADDCEMAAEVYVYAFGARFSEDTGGRAFVHTNLVLQDCATDDAVFRGAARYSVPVAELALAVAGPDRVDLGGGREAFYNTLNLLTPAETKAFYEELFRRGAEYVVNNYLRPAVRE